MAIQIDKLKRMFDADSKLMLETLNRLISETADGTMEPGMVDRAFRAAHSIKSEAGVLELSGVAAAAHALESTLSDIRSNNGADKLGRLKNELSTLTGEIEQYQRKRPVPADHASRAASPAEPGLNAPELGMLREAKARNETLFRLVFRATCEPEFIYPRVFLVVNNLEISSSVVQVNPPLERLEGSKDGRVSVLLTTTGNDETVRRAVSVDEVEVLDIARLSYDELRPLTEPAAPLYEAAGTVLNIDARSQEEILLFADEISHIASTLHRNLPSLGLPDTEVTGITRLNEFAHTLQGRVDRTARVQLLDVVRSMKEWTVSHAQSAGKQARLVVGGSGAFVYTVVADTIADALLHIVRNSIDHGIESPAERSARGKKPEGIVKVGIEHFGDSIRVRITDDGCGINESAIRERTGERQKPLLDILSAPGFTQRREADHSSGRGVGLDSVVHTVRDLLSGGIEIRSQFGKGTILSMSIPVTSRLVNVLIVESSDGPAAVPASMVVEHRGLNLQRFKRDSFGGRYYDYHGQSLPLLTLFGKDPADETLSGDSVGIVVRCGTRNTVLAVARVVSSEAVVRDEVKRGRVYSRVVGREVPYVFPPAFLIG